jgi:hypothetical protein
MPKIEIKGKLTTEAAMANLTDSEKRSLALKLLEETDPQVADAVHLAEQERDTQAKLDMAQHDEEKRQRAEKHYWIEINRRGVDDSESHVFVGAGGVSYWIQKDVAVPVPKSVLDVLDNAIIIGHVPVTDEGLGVKFIKKVKVKRYPYSRLGEATPDEITKFRAEQDDIRKAADDTSIGQEMAKAQLQRESLLHQDDAPFIPAYLQGETEKPV